MLLSRVAVSVKLKMECCFTEFRHIFIKHCNSLWRVLAYALIQHVPEWSEDV